MNYIINRSLLLGGLLLWTLSGFAQQIFPVNVSGQLLPPNSLRIGDYFTGERDNDLMFTVALNDPIEETRQVKLRLSIENNGGVVLQSDLAQAPIITLDRNFPEMYTGADLLPYFNTLSNAQGQGVPLFLTPGLNGFCLEVIDLATEKIISNPGCALGVFAFAQPPLLQLPACQAPVEYTGTQNLTFSWLPMHNASGNPINDINYVFQLVEVPEAFQNPKDAFDAGFFRHVQDVRNMTTLLYTEAEPLLEVGKKYAWRVRAQALSMDENIVPLFDNNGYSNICTFTYEDGGPPPDPDNFSSCMGSPCNYTSAISTTPKGEGYFSGDEIKIAHYRLTFEEVSYDEGGETYSGTGSIPVSFLGTSIAVEFTDLQINGEDRAYAGEVKARIDDESVIPSDFRGDFSDISLANASQLTNITDADANALADYFNNNPLKLFTNLSQVGESATTSLPIGLDVELNVVNQTHVIAITDILFTPTNSKLNAVYVSADGSENPIKFGSRGVCFRNNGLVEANPQLFLLSEVNLVTTLGVPMILQPVGAGGAGTTVQWSCDGFERFSLQGRVELDNSMVLPADLSQETLVAQFSATANSLLDFTATVEIPDFTIANLGDFTFKAGQGLFDYSSTEQLPDVQWPEGFTEPALNWEGFFFPDISIELPVVFGNSDGNLPSIVGTNIIFDDKGFTGKLAGTNLMTGEDQLVGGWPFNIDEFSLTFKENDLIRSGMDGKTRLPFMDEGEWIGYTGALVPVVDSITNQNGWNIQLGATAEEVGIGLFRASFKFDSESTITIPYINGSFGLPRCDLSGLLSFDLPDTDIGFDPEFMSILNGLDGFLSNLGIGDLSPTMDLSGLRFEHMTFDWTASPKFNFGTIRPIDLDLSFMSINADISAITWKQIGVTDTGLPKYGFDFDINFPELGNLSPNIDFNIGFGWNSSSTPSGGGSLFNFDGFDLNFGLPEFSFPDFDISCGEDIPDIEIQGETPVLDITAVPEIKVGFFDLEGLRDIVDGELENSFNGVGKISIAALGPFSEITVGLKDVVVNEAGQVISGTIEGLLDDSFGEAEDLQNAAGDILAAANEKIANVANLAGELTTLPIILGVRADGTTERDQGLIITGLKFGPQGAEVDAKIVVPLGNDQFIEFDARGLELVPNGIAGGELRMGLTSDFDLPIPGGDVLHVKAYDGTQGSYVAIDCGGFVEFNLMGTHDLPSGFVAAEGNEPVTLNFTINTQEWGEFLGNITTSTPFELEGLGGITFALGNGRLDFSTNRNVNEMQFPRGYSSRGPAWEGFFAPELTVTVPADLSPGNEAMTFTANNVLIDSLGFSGDVLGRGLVDLSAGSLGGWAASLDSFLLTIRYSNLVKGIMGGGMQLPVMQGDETLPYTATFAPAAGPNYYNFNFAAKPTVVDISLLRSRFSFDTTSVLTVGYENGSFQTPIADLSGTISFLPAPDDDGFSEEFYERLDEFALLFPDIGSWRPTFNMEAIEIKNFRFDYRAERMLSVRSFTPRNTSITFLGQTADLSGINLADVEIDSTAIANGINAGARLMSFDFKTKVASEYLGALAPTVTVKMQITEDPVGDGGFNYDFYRFDLDYEMGGITKLNVDCQTTPPPITFAETDYAGPFTGESIEVGYFTLEEISVIEDDEAGRISGSGRVRVPMLGPMSTLNVAFEDVLLDANGRIREGEVLTVSDFEEEEEPDPDEEAAETRRIGLILAAAKDKLTSAADAFSLPVIIGDENVGFTLVGMSLLPERATIRAKVIVKTGEEEYVEFVGDGLELVPDGIASVNARLGLGRSFTIRGLDGALPVNLLPYDPINDKGTYATVDCDGFQFFSLEGAMEFSREVLLSRKKDENDEPETVVGAFSASAESFSKILGSLSVNDSVYIVGADELPFYLGEALIDLHDTQDHQNVVFPRFYNQSLIQNWQGVYVSNASMPLPEILADNSTEAPGTLGVEKLVMDANGFTGTFRGDNLLNMETTSLYGFGMSLDSCKIQFAANNLLIGQMDGRFNVPLAEAGEGIPYRSLLAPNRQNPTRLDFSWIAKPGEVRFPDLSADFNFNDRSSITITRTATGFSYPRFDLSGTFKVSGDGQGLGNEMDELITAVNDATGTTILPDFNIDSINFEHFVFDYDNPDGFLTVETIDPVNTEVRFLGQTVELQQIRFGTLDDLGVALDVATDSVSAFVAENAGDELRKLGLRFDLDVTLPVIGEIPIGFTINLDELGQVADGLRNYNYDFSGIKLDYELPDLTVPDFTCESGELPEPPADQRQADLTLSTRVKVNGFEMRINELNGDSGTGKIRIPFMNYTMNVSFDNLEVNAAGELIAGEVVTDTESSLVPDDAINTEEPDVPVLELSPALTSFLASTQDFFTLPISLADKLEETAGLELPEGMDLILLGIVWNEQGAKMNLVLTVPNFIEGDDPLQFGIRGLNLRPDGIDLGELKIFLARSIRF